MNSPWTQTTTFCLQWGFTTECWLHGTRHFFSSGKIQRSRRQLSSTLMWPPMECHWYQGTTRGLSVVTKPAHSRQGTGGTKKNQAVCLAQMATCGYLWSVCPRCNCATTHRPPNLTVPFVSRTHTPEHVRSVSQQKLSFAKVECANLRYTLNFCLICDQLLCRVEQLSYRSLWQIFAERKFSKWFFPRWTAASSVTDKNITHINEFVPKSIMSSTDLRPSFCRKSEQAFSRCGT